MEKRPSSNEDPAYLAFLCSECRELSATQSCDCGGSTLYFCHKCLQSHCRAPGPHSLERVPSIRKLPRVSVVKSERGAALQCEVCKSVEAQSVCICTTPAIPLCVSCVFTHTQEDVLREHTLHPAEVAERFASPAYVSSFRVRQRKIRETQEKLTQLLSDMEVTQGEILTRTNALIERLQHFRDQKVKELNSIKLEFEAKLKKAMTEIRTHIYEDDLDSTDSLAVSIWHQTCDDMSMLTFSGVSFLDSFDTDLHRIVLPSAQIQSQCFAELLPVVKKASFKMFDFKAKSWLQEVPLSTSINIDAGSSLLYADQKRLFVCGGFEPKVDTAYLIDCGDGTVQSLAKMRKPRGWAGSWSRGRAIYVFGGQYARDLKMCEKYSFDTSAWMKIPDMNHSRSGFNPCMKDGYLYLAGGDIRASIEKFDFVSEAFALIDIMIPGAMYTVLLVTGSNFLLVQESAYCVVNIEKKELEKESQKMEESISASSFPPVVFEKSVYLLSDAGKLAVLDLERMKYKTIDEE